MSATRDQFARAIEAEFGEPPTEADDADFTVWLAGHERTDIRP